MNYRSISGEMLRPGLQRNSRHVMEALNSGFNVFVRSDFHEILKVFHEEIEKRKKTTPMDFVVVKNYLDFSKIPKNYNSKILVITSEEFYPGIGYLFVEYNDIEILLGSVSRTIEILLKEQELLHYIECFDAEIVKKLRKIMTNYGLSLLIDCIMQTAYLSGFKGDRSAAIAFLERLQNGKSWPQATSFSLENSAASFMNFILDKEDRAYDYLKSAFSYFAVAKYGSNISKASSKLGISRTTLHEYVKNAETLGVDKLFQDKVKTPHHKIDRKR